MFKTDKQDSVAWEWVFALRTLDIVHRIATCPTYPLEIQVFRLGDAAIVGWPGEPFVEAQLEVKLASPAPYTIVGHECNSNGECGYLPTPAAIARGGYETWGTLPPGTLATLTTQTMAVLTRLWSIT